MVKNPTIKFSPGTHHTRKRDFLEKMEKRTNISLLKVIFVSITTDWKPVHYTLNEAETRYNLIDPSIAKAGWNLSDRSQIWFEVPVQGYDASPQSGITDYCMFRANGEVLAVVEAKRTRRDARVGKEQVLQYVTEIGKTQTFRPFAFMANGGDIFFWDSEQYPERMVAGFFSREDLERLLFLKQNQLPLSEIKINDTIVNRSYQIEAIRRISETVEKRNKRKALLVMATGTGKTRTVMALVDVFLRARRAQKFLFLADRDSLVNQALSDGFKIHLPNESRSRIRTYNIDKTSSVCVRTLQTLELCYEIFSLSEFDVVLSDECHRSIYNNTPMCLHTSMTTNRAFIKQYCCKNENWKKLICMKRSLPTLEQR